MASNGKKILVVEDNELAAKMAKILFERQGCVVDCVPSGEEAIELAKPHGYSVIYMDIGLAGEINGVTACLKIREYEASHPSLTPVPIVAVSANVTNETTKQYLNAGMQEVFEKPLSQDKVSKILGFC